MRPPSALSIVICAFNGLEYTKLLVKSIREQSRYAHDIVVYSDGSTDGTRDWLLQQEDLRWMHDPANRGICTAMNRAARMAAREYLFFPNTDHVLAPGWDDAMLRRMAPRTVVSCQCIEPGIVPVAAIFHARHCGGRYDEFDEGAFHRAAAELARDRAVPGVNYPFAISRALWDELGGLDELFNPGPANDPDLFYRLKLSGAEMVRADDCLVYHFSGKSSRLAGEATAEHRHWHEVTVRNEARFAEKWGERYRYANGGLPDPGAEARRRWEAARPAPAEARTRLKVAIDFAAIEERTQGIGTYATSLVRALARRDDLDVVPYKGSPPASANVLHGPAFALPRSLKMPGVATIHDIAFKLHPEWYPGDFVEHMDRVVHDSVARAAFLIAVSDRTRTDLLTHYAADGSKVVRIHEGTPDDATGHNQGPEALRAARTYAGGKPFILAVGVQQKRKNAVGLLRAFLRLKEVGGVSEKLLLIGGQECEDPRLAEEIARHRLEGDIIRTGHIPRHDLLALYRAARLVVYPSLHEGFGLPPLEAMAAEAPVIASESLAEVTGDAALLVDPEDPAKLADAMRAGLGEPGLRDRLRTAGLRRVKEFTWDRAAEETSAVYRKAVQRPAAALRSQPTLRIAFDGRLLGQRRLGTGRYSEEILAALLQANHESDFVVIGPEHVPLGDLPGASRITQHVAAGPETILNAQWEQFALPTHLLGCDALLSPTGIAPITAPCPTVPVIHDLGFEDHPEYYEPALRAHLASWIRKGCLSAARIVAVSEFTKNRLTKLYGIAPDRIEVVHHGQPRRSPESHRTKEPFVLAVSSFEPNKNLGVLIEAFASIRDRWPGRLVLAGRSGRDLEAVRSLAGKHRLDGRVQILPDLDEATVDRLYVEATLFAFPSAYEGFGLPLLEAMAAGLPVAVGPAEAAREVAGDAAVTVDKPEDWADTLIGLLEDPTRRSELSRRSRGRAAAFSWSRAADRTFQVLQAAVEAR